MMNIILVILMFVCAIIFVTIAVHDKYITFKKKRIKRNSMDSLPPNMTGTDEHEEFLGIETWDSSRDDN